MYQSYFLPPCIQCRTWVIYKFLIYLFIFFLKKNVLGEYIDSRDAKGIADLLNEKLEAIQNKGKRKKSRNKVRTLSGGAFAEDSLL